VEGESGGCLSYEAGSGRRENQSTLTFIARDQHPPFGLEIGWNDIAEAMGQDMVCLIVDVLPAVSTGLEGQTEEESRKVSSKS
jgi:hypothetical protein